MTAGLRTALRLMVATVVLAAAFLTFRRSTGEQVDVASTLALAAAVVLGLDLLNQLAAPKTIGRRRRRRRPADPRALRRVTLLRLQLERSASTPGDFDALIRPVLTAVAHDWLQYRHGVDVTRRPARARALLGEELWDVLTNPQSAPDIATLDRLTQRFEDA